ncbi:DNA repair protein XRCC2 homolog [Linum perenne]
MSELGRAVIFVDLDCRFDVLCFWKVFVDANRGGGACDDEELKASCLRRRFLYVRCYDSFELLGTLKTLRDRIHKVLNAVHCLMIVNIGFEQLLLRSSIMISWVVESHYVLVIQLIRIEVGNVRKGLSLDKIWEAVVREIRRVLLVHPILVITTKATIIGDASDSTAHLEFMPYVSHRVHVRAADDPRDQNWNGFFLLTVL